MTIYQGESIRLEHLSSCIGKEDISFVASPDRPLTLLLGNAVGNAQITLQWSDGSVDVEWTGVER